MRKISEEYNNYRKVLEHSIEGITDFSLQAAQNLNIYRKE